MPDDLPDLRASHEDRDRVVDTLRVAGGDGRLTAGELEARLERALSARTVGDLAELTADLPSAPAVRDVLVVEQHGGKYVKEGRWLVLRASRFASLTYQSHADQWGEVTAVATSADGHWLLHSQVRGREPLVAFLRTSTTT